MPMVVLSMTIIQTKIHNNAWIMRLIFRIISSEQMYKYKYSESIDTMTVLWPNCIHYVASIAFLITLLESVCCAVIRIVHETELYVHTRMHMHSIFSAFWST